MTLPPGWGVLVVGHGTVEHPSELPAFLSRIRGGRPYAPELLDALVSRYAAIGGSPLLRNTELQAEGLFRRLGAPVLVGMRHAPPEIGDALRRAFELGLRGICVLPLAPFSGRVYLRAVTDEMDRLSRAEVLRPFRLVGVESWADQPLLVEAHRESIAASIATLSVPAALVMSAHSLPSIAAKGGEPYAERIRTLADEIARALGVHQHDLAFQSQGDVPGEWLGPELGAVMRDLRARGAGHVVVAPIGFLADHVETLYDLDIEAASLARDLGLGFTRVPALNASRTLVEAMAQVVESALLGQPLG
jgi:ferrochelatase